MEQINGFALRKIKEEIPREILEDTFRRRALDNSDMFQYVTMDSAIVSAVLAGSVYMDVQLISGRETNIDLNGLEPTFNSDGSAVISVPLSVTGGRPILEVYRVGFASTNYSNALISSPVTSEIDRALNEVIDATSHIPVTSTTRCEMIAPNTILVHDVQNVHTFTNAEVNLALSSEMTHIPPKAFHKFGELCVNKCKQYIYNFHRVNMDRGQVERGYGIGAFAEVIAEYSDAGQIYKDLLTAWRRTEFHLDIEKKTKFVKSIVKRL